MYFFKVSQLLCSFLTKVWGQSVRYLRLKPGWEGVEGQLGCEGVDRGEISRSTSESELMHTGLSAPRRACWREICATCAMLLLAKLRTRVSPTSASPEASSRRNPPLQLHAPPAYTLRLALLTPYSGRLRKHERTGERAGGGGRTAGIHFPTTRPASHAPHAQPKAPPPTRAQTRDDARCARGTRAPGFRVQMMGDSRTDAYGKSRTQGLGGTCPRVVIR